MPKRKPPKPPTEASHNIQHDLFSTFLDNNRGHMSNLVDIWQSIPKYFLTPTQVKNLRTSNGLAQPFEHEYTLRSRAGESISFTVVLQPALIKQSDGTHKAFFPSITEELMEEALKKIFASQTNGIHVPEKLQSWVKFSYSMLLRELKENGHERNQSQIKHALDVMRLCNITVYRGGKEIYSGGIISEYAAVDREQYLNDKDSYHLARLPSFISESINTLRYRQFNYKRLMACDSQLTRWLYQRLITKYTNAALMNTYHFTFSDVQQSSGLLMQKDNRHNRAKMLKAMDEMYNNQIILSYETTEKKEGRKTVDVVYEVRPHPEFVAEQKSANKRHQNAIDTAKMQGKLQLFAPTK